MWPLLVMELTFAAGILSLVADMGARSRPSLRRVAPPAVVLVGLAASVAALVQDWGPSMLGEALQPVSDPVASLYVVDKFTTFTAFTVLVVGFAACVYAAMYFEAEERSAPFFALLSILLCSLVGVISAGDYLVLFLFWEGMSVSAYGLVSFGKSDVSLEASLKYFFMAGTGSLLALFGIGAIYTVAGGLQLSAAGSVLFASSPYGELGIVLLIVGLGVEAAIVPLHTWLPDVYSATPVPVASVVSGAVTGTGVFAILKVVQPLVSTGSLSQGPLPSFGVGDLQLVLAFFALLTMTVGNLSALAQSNFRKLLSFSSVAQTGYMLAALSTLSATGLVAVVFTVWNHGLLKSNFFMLLGRRHSSLEDSTLESLKGAGREDRPLGLMFAASSLAMVGAPPFGMFWSEVLVVQSLVLASAPVFYLLAVAVVLNVAMSIGYYFRVINTVVFGDAADGGVPSRRSMLLPAGALLGLSLATGLAPFLILGQVL